MPVLSAVLVLAVLLSGGAYHFFVMKQTPASSSASRPAAPVIPKGPEHILSVTPADGATAANGGGPFTVHFEILLSKDSPMPVLAQAERNRHIQAEVLRGR